MPSRPEPCRPRRLRLPTLIEIVFDTETTGTDHASGDRVVEIGCVELINHVPSGRTFHKYLNPERPMSSGALAVHGLTDAFLADKPLFGSVAAELHEFFGPDAKLVAHNALFDLAFLNVEFGRSGHPALGLHRIVDTLTLARRRHPNGPNSLDALCQRYGIDNSRRTQHGALLDAELLAEVYLELIGGRQADLGLTVSVAVPMLTGGSIVVPGGGARLARPAARAVAEADIAAHLAYVATLGASPVWRDYVGEGP